jgi:5-formyltetrahydrofolate cyclo-ligase
MPSPFGINFEQILICSRRRELTSLCRKEMEKCLISAHNSQQWIEIKRGRTQSVAILCYSNPKVTGYYIRQSTEIYQRPFVTIEGDRD